jgi:hypothetical protein
MKLSKTVPPGPRVVPLEEYQAHGLDHPTAAACLFFAPFVALHNQAPKPKAPEWRCHWFDSDNVRQSLGSYTCEREMLAVNIQPQNRRDYVEENDTTGALELVRSTFSGEKRFPIIVELVKDDTQDPDAYNFRNMNRSPLPLVPKQAPLGLPKSAPPSVPSDCEEATLADIQSALVSRGLVLSDGSAKALAKATAKERRLFSRVECVTATDTSTEQDNCGAWIATESAPYVVKTLEVFTEAAHYRFPVTDNAPANQETPAAPASV